MVECDCRYCGFQMGEEYICRGLGRFGRPKFVCPVCGELTGLSKVIVLLVDSGKTDDEIAQELGITVEEVRNEKAISDLEWFFV